MFRHNGTKNGTMKYSKTKYALNFVLSIKTTLFGA